MKVGWRPPEKHGTFDLSPLLIETPADREQWLELPADAVLEVSIAHPAFGWFEELGLKWHAPHRPRRLVVARAARFRVRVTCLPSFV